MFIRANARSSQGIERLLKCNEGIRFTHRRHTREGGYPVRRAFSIPSLASRNTGSSGPSAQLRIRPDDDEHGHSRDSIRPSFAKFIGPQRWRAQGRPGARCTRGLVCKHAHRKRTRAYRFSGGSPAFPAQWFYGLLRALPGETWLACHRRPRDAKHHRELDTSHWGVRTTRLRRPRTLAIVFRKLRVHRIPPRVFVTCATPSRRVGRHGIRI
jgi:hypothetical protein